jgi:hypothetical protein
MARTIASPASSIAWLFGLVVTLLATVATADDPDRTRQHRRRRHDGNSRHADSAVRYRRAGE